MYVLSHNGATKWTQNKFQTCQINKVLIYDLYINNNNLVLFSIIKFAQGGPVGEE